MFITTLWINVGWSSANRSLVMDVCSFVDLLFVVDPSRKADGCGIVHEHVDFDLFSFVQASSVEVFVRSSLSDLFLVDIYDIVTCMIMYDVREVMLGARTSRKDLQGKGYPTLTRTNFEGKR